MRLPECTFWTWDTFEVLDMIRWMRSYNEDPNHKSKLKFYGFDMAYSAGSAQYLIDFFRTVDRAFAAKAEHILAVLDNDMDMFHYSKLPREKRQATAEGIARIVKRLWDNKKNYIRRSSRFEWAIAWQHARVVNQAQQCLVDGRARDHAMAENVKSRLEEEKPGARMVLWAHNEHVSMSNQLATWAPWRSMGAYLKESLGSALVVFGLIFNRGSFQAVPMNSQTGKGLVEFTVAAASVGSLEGALAAVGKPIFALDLRRAPSNELVADWLSTSRPRRQIPAAYSDDGAEKFWVERPPRAEFDALLFVNDTSAARPNQTRPAFAVQPKAAALTNLKFEDGSLGAVPDGWWVPHQWERGRYVVALSDEKAFEGKRCAVIERERSPWNWGIGQLSQRIGAETFRGKRVRLRAAARAEVSGPGNKAELFLQVDPPESVTPVINSLAFVSTFDPPIRSRVWRTYEVEADVPKEADSITIGFALAGNGRAWLDDVSFEIVRRR
jgi:erythromycin esterase